ncbi:MAG: glutamate-cysteine ligase family protein [Acidobacteria bacterium]|nr:glutamate-cysteine ligase family protein [Acidobacteriota bacterium]
MNQQPRYRLLEVTGIELEYPVVDAEMRSRPLVEGLFRKIAGRPTSEVEYGAVIFSNEMASHIFEAKIPRPEHSLTSMERKLVSGVRAANAVLRSEWGARLLPTGMNPFMDPADGRTWPRAGRAIYQAYADLFDVREHGWMNVHSCHINLPFGNEQERVLLHNAICCLLPYLPALAASSPIYEGKLGPNVCNRLAFYGGNQKRFPRISGQVVPEYMESSRQYRRDILGAIYEDLRRVPGAERLRHEWINSRGAIMRFNRDAIEIRVLDVQECPKMDLALASFVRAALKFMMQALRDGEMSLPEHGLLVGDYDAVVERGSRARVAAPHLRRLLGVRARAARDVLRELLVRIEPLVPAGEKHYLPLVGGLIESGNLSERMRGQILRTRAASRHGAMREMYEELALCLEMNAPWRH